MAIAHASLFLWPCAFAVCEPRGMVAQAPNVSSARRSQERGLRRTLRDRAKIPCRRLYSIRLYAFYGTPPTSVARMHRYVLMTRSRRRVRNSIGMRTDPLTQPLPATSAAAAWRTHRNEVAEAPSTPPHQGAMAAASALATAGASRCGMRRGV